MASRGWESVTAADVARMACKPLRTPSARRSKFNAVKTTVDGIMFHSRREAVHYGGLKNLEKAGEITHLELQPVYPLIVNGVLIGRYVGDFRFYRPDGELVLLDVKSEPTKTPSYRLKKKLVAALYGITITEVA